MDEKQANEMIDKICEWLSDGAKGHFSKNDKRFIYETIESDIARDFCIKLLTASKADGSGGCRLCER